MKILQRFFLILVVSFLMVGPAGSFQVKFADDTKTTFVLNKIPGRVVSLVPTITEIMYKLGAQDRLVGITYHTTFPGETVEKSIVGGFFEPSIKTIEKLNPDIIFVSSLHKEVRSHFKGTDVMIIELGISSVADGIHNIELLGRIFGRQNKADAIKKMIDEEILLITKKLARIQPKHKKRVMRLMGRDRVMTPGTDSFQNELIRMAGGISHDFNRNGSIIEVSKEEWMRFNPEILYGCGKDSEIEALFLSQPGWKDVDAVKNKRIYYFPCDLTCRAATNTGYFIQWLASAIYGNKFAPKENRFLTSGITRKQEIEMPLDYVENVNVIHSHILDFKNKSLVIDLKAPMTIVSTLEGQRNNIRTVLNHYTPPQNWMVDHEHGIGAVRKRITDTLEKNPDQTSLLITGADMDHVTVKISSHKELKVFALITAGVESNAMRMGKSKGGFYEPGTINIILMSNMKLSGRAMTRAIITATEAKTAALVDMDIRTSYDDGAYKATGTGTDNVLVIEGQGKQLEVAGGHSKLGELIANVVYEGVQEAIFKQNGLSPKRSVFQRLKKRGITVYSLIAKEKCDCGRSKSQFVGEVEELLLDSRYAGFVEMALALSDEYEKGMIKDLSLFKSFSRQVAMEISEGNLEEIKPLIKEKELPLVIQTALNALLNGVYYRSL